MNKDQIKGRVKEAKGEIKKDTGKLFGNKKLEVEGTAEKAAGKVQKRVGDLKHAVDKKI
jgi:uncharacterized protein YjbJ (UPF0337 family)